MPHVMQQVVRCTVHISERVLFLCPPFAVSTKVQYYIDKDDDLNTSLNSIRS